MNLPNGNTVSIEQINRKLVTYALSETHPKGKHKATLFRARLGITLQNKEILIAALLKNAAHTQATYNRTSSYGKHYQIDFSMTTSVGTSGIRSAWIVKPDGQCTALTSVYPIR